MTIELTVTEMLEECAALMEERGAKYGPIDETFKKLACLWSIRTGVSVKPSDVCDMMEDLKWVRAQNMPAHHDNGPDAVNYKAFAYALRERGM